MIPSAVTPVYIPLPAGSKPPPVKPTPNRMVVIIEQKVNAEWQAEISKWIVDTGCLFMMAWGENCSSWDDSVDYANIDDFGNGTIPDECFVLTTWHDDEPLGDVLWFCRHTAFHSHVALLNTYIVHICEVPREQEILELFWKDLPDE